MGVVSRRPLYRSRAKAPEDVARALRWTPAEAVEQGAVFATVGMVFAAETSSLVATPQDSVCNIRLQNRNLQCRGSLKN